MTVHELLQISFQLAPTDTAWDKDNIGLLVGRPEASVTHALVSLDVSLDVIREARTWGAQVILSHHPLIFGGVKTVTNQTAHGRRVTELIRSDIAAICLHTNYDGAVDGINDELAHLLGLCDVGVLVNHNGEYGRYGHVHGTMSVRDFACFVRDTLKATGLRYLDAGKPVSKVCVGSGGSGGLFERVLEAGCDTFVTGDVKHSLFCDARDVGLNVIDATHFATEDIMCNMLVSRLAAMAPSLNVKKASASRAPYETI